MTAADLLTVGHADPWFRAILSRVEALAERATPSATGEVVLFSVAELAQRLKADESTVRKWLKTGKMSGPAKR